MEKTLSPRQLAEAVGVSQSSVKRWVDAGRIEASTTAGGHRRIPLAAALRFLRRTNIPLVSPARLGLAVPAGLDFASNEIWPRRFTQALREGRTAEAVSLARLAFAAGRDSAWVVDQGLAPALDEIGAVWRSLGEEGVFIEHRATQIGILVLEELRMLQGPPEVGTRPALGAAPAGDPYLLPTLAAGVVVEDCGLPATNLGPNTPDGALVAAIEQMRPALVWLSFTTVRPDWQQEQTVRRAARAAARVGAALVLGGQAGPVVPGSVPVDYRGTSMAELAAFARGLTRGTRKQRKAGAPGGAR